MTELTFAKTLYTTLGDWRSQEELKEAIVTPSQIFIFHRQQASDEKTYYTDCQGKVFQRSRSNAEPVGNPFSAFSTKYVRDSNIPPRALTLKQAAAYVGLTPRSYREAVRHNRYPDIMPGTRRYDRNAIDARLNDASGMTQHHDM